MSQSSAQDDHNNAHSHLSDNEKALLPYFEDSLSESSFRTLTYNHESTDSQEATVWREAHKIPESGWFIFEKKRSPITLHAEIDKAISKPSVTQKAVLANLTFFEAIEALSVFETSQAILGFKPLSKSEITELGKSYYKTAAEKEGIIFNIQGLPHPTLNGNVIAENQSFLEEDYSKAASSPQRKKEKGFKKTLPSLFSEAAPTINVKRGVSFTNEMDTLTLLKKAVKKLKDFTEEANEKGWLHDVGSYSNSYITFARYLKRISNSQLRPVFNKLSGERFEGIENKDAFIKNIRSAINLTQFYMNACKAVSAYKSYKENGPAMSYLHYKGAKSKAIKYLKQSEMYDPSEAEKILDHFMNDLSDINKETLSKLEHIIDWAGTLKKEFQMAQNASKASITMDDLPKLETNSSTKAQLPAP